MNYEISWSNLNAKLQSIAMTSGGLSAALDELEIHQRESGFIQDDLQNVRRLVFGHPTNTDLNFRVQLNPKRAQRHGGAGVAHPPPGEESLNNGCFLCRENIRWQQGQRQIGFEIEASGGIYYAWMNPFPLLPNHVVVASQTHIPQGLQLFSNKSEDLKLERVLTDLCETAKQLPNHVGFYNGIGAGASIPGHLHFQFFRRAPEAPKFPLEERLFQETKSDDAPDFILDYPISVVRWRGQLTEVVLKARDWITRWASVNDFEQERLTANFVATFSNECDELNLYFVPRHRDKQFWNGDKGIVGGLEVLGELVMASSDECALVENGTVDYGFIENALSFVSTPVSLLDS